MDELPDDETVVQGGFKPSFDGRQMYYDVMKKFLLAQKLSALQGDLRQWYRSLRILFNMCHSYMRKSDADNLRKKLEKINTQIIVHEKARLPQTRTAIGSNVEKELLTLEEELHYAAREMFLPIKSEDTDGWNNDEFERKSDA